MPEGQPHSILNRRALFWACSAFLAFLALAAAFAWGEWRRAGPLPQAATVFITRGSGLNGIAARLETAGVVRSALAFRLAAYMTGSASGLRAGEYQFTAGQSLAAVLDQIRAGRVVIRRVTFPEGLTVHEIRMRLAQAEGLRAAAVIADPPEGSLLPETYLYGWGDQDVMILRKMRDDMAALLDELWARRKSGLPFQSKEEAVILASIVEKETGVASERPLVASVFLNRLRVGMPLQSDPTVIYGLTQGGKRPMERALTFADLRMPHPWNTYVIPGLPPSPIANPGRASLEAVLIAPAESDYFYFVADGTGGHAFARTLADHNRNVARWREINR